MEALASPTAPAPSGRCQTCGQQQRSQDPATANCTDAVGWSGYVYGVGRLVPQFASLGVEKEFIQLTERAATDAQVDMELLRQILDDPENRYLGRHLCWVFSAQGVDTLIVLPRDDIDVAKFAESITPGPEEDLVHALVGRAPGAMDLPCTGLGLPSVVADQLLSFTVNEFAERLLSFDTQSSDNEPAGGRELSSDQRRIVIREIFLRLTRRASNRGLTDEHRALNYMALRYPAIYYTGIQAYSENKTLVGIEAQKDHAPGRQRVSVRLIFRHRRTELVERYHCLVDVTDVFPFISVPFKLIYD